MLSTSAKHLKLLTVASAVIRLKSEIILDANTKISRTWDTRVPFFTSARKFDPELVI